MDIEKSTYGTLSDGQAVDIYTLTNDNGMTVKILNYGGIIQSIEVPSASGDKIDVVLGLDSLEDYMQFSPYFGCITGRYANRINGGKFTLDGKQYQLETNNNGHHLHGGYKGFDKALWKAHPVKNHSSVCLELTHLSPDGDGGYPGDLHCKVVYTLTNTNSLEIGYKAVTDKPTIINLTNHSYFNLSGQGSIYRHQLYLNADTYTEIDENFIPTGQIKSALGTAMDFTKPAFIGDKINSVKGGFDHNYIINAHNGKLALAAELSCPDSGIKMTVQTTEPAFQFYSGNFLDGTAKGKNQTYTLHSGLCLETQHYPDSPNHRNFPTTTLMPQEQFKSMTVYSFKTGK